jgi:hypothetical protein
MPPRHSVERVVYFRVLQEKNWRHNKNGDGENSARHNRLQRTANGSRIMSENPTPDVENKPRPCFPPQIAAHRRFYGAKY